MDWDDHRRKQRLRETRLGSGWTTCGRLRRVGLRSCLALVPLLILLGQYWSLDVAPEQRRLARTQPWISQVYGALAPADDSTAVVDLVGLGNVDAAETARALPEFARVGRVWAVRYDNRGIDTRVISELVTERARTAGVENIVLVGHSMGGVIALEVAQHIYEDSDRKLAGVVLDCTPVDLHAVRGSSRDAGEDLLRWIGWLPGARESRTLRSVVEMAARHDRFIDSHSTWYPRVHWSDALDTAEEVLRDKIFDRSAASNGFIESQFRAIVASGAVDNLDALGQSEGGAPRPAIVFLRPEESSADNVVDVNYSQRVLFERSGGTERSLRVVRIPGTGHANPIQEPEMYNASIGSDVVPFLRARIFDSGQSRRPLEPIARVDLTPP